MDCGWYNSRQEKGSRVKLIHENDQVSLIDEMTQDFRLPINHKPTENVDLDNVEQASLDTQLTSSNIGFRLLQKMGWKGKGLEKDEQGIIEPIKFGIRDPKLGIGKQEEDDFFTAEENIQRKKLDVEVEEKLAMEFEAHLSSYDHNHRKRFKEMKEMHGTGGRDDREKREQQRDKEMAKFAQMADARKQLHMQQKLDESAGTSVSSEFKVATALADQEQRRALKFGFSSKRSNAKTLSGSAVKKPKVAVASVFGNVSEEE